jgi:hypothetical protein
MRILVIALGSLSLVLILLFVTTPGKAYPYDLEDNIAYLGFDHEDVQVTGYVGQEWIDVNVWLGLPTESFLLTLESPLSEEPAYHTYNGPFEPGFRAGYGVYPVNGSPPGLYPVKAYLNYTLLNGTSVQRVFEYTIDYVLAWEAKEFKVSKNRTLVLELETYVDMMWVSVEFQSPHPHRLEVYDFKEYNVTPGTHRFEAAFLEDPRDWNITEVTVGYHAEAYPEWEILELEEKGVTFSLEEDKKGVPVWAYVLLGLVLGPLVVLVLVLLLRTGREQGADGEGRLDRGRY